MTLLRPATSRFNRISELAVIQDGVVGTQQLERLVGLTSSQIARLTAQGYLFRVRRGVYAVGRPAISARGHIRAAVIACHGRCLVSHESAAYLLGLAGPSRPIHLTRGPGGPSRRQGLLYHQVRDLEAVPRKEMRGLHVTTVARTLRDLSAGMPLEDLLDLAARGQRRRILSVTDLHAQEAMNRGRPGTRRFRSLLKMIDPDVLATRSRMERRILWLCERWGLPRPKAGVVVEGFEVDLFWPEERLIVEFDSRAYHTDVRAFERDHRRDARHLAAGYRTFRVTFSMLEEDPEAVVAQIAALLDRGRREIAALLNDNLETSR